MAFRTKNAPINMLSSINRLSADTVINITLTLLTIVLSTYLLTMPQPNAHWRTANTTQE